MDIQTMYEILYDNILKDEDLTHGQLVRALAHLENLSDEDIIKLYKETTEE